MSKKVERLKAMVTQHGVVFERETADYFAQRNYPRIAVTVAGADGHPPLHLHSAPFVRYAPMDIDGIKGWEYRAPGPQECALVFAAAAMDAGRVLAWIWVPCDEAGASAGVNTIFDSFMAALGAKGLVRAFWPSLEALAEDQSADAKEARSAWPLQWVVDGRHTLPLVT